ncbi:MAG: Rab family GTPase [Candidatus Asgardarchaeia archaeon]
MKTRDNLLKFIVVGETDVGKTSFVIRWSKGVFPDPSLLHSTIGASFDVKKLKLSNNDTIYLQIWDFAGQSRFTKFMYDLVIGAKLGLLFFDLSNLRTLDTITNFWIPRISEILHIDFEKGEGNSFILVGNKLDLITLEEALRLSDEVGQIARKFGLDLIFISAKEGTNIDKLEKMIISKIEQLYYSPKAIQ